MKELAEAIAKALVDNPDQVQVRTIEGEQVTVFELRVRPSDLGKVIGRQGRTASAIRTMLTAAGMKLRKRFAFRNPRLAPEHTHSGLTLVRILDHAQNGPT